MTEEYLRILTPGLCSYSINWTLTSWLQTIELAHVPAYAALVGALLHVPFNLLFIHVLGLGWLGVAVATVTFQAIQPVLMFAYLKGTAHGRAQLLCHNGAQGIGKEYLTFWTEAKAAISSAAGIIQYLQLALPGILAISEWWASEICIFLSGKLHPSNEIALGAMAIYQSLNSTCFMLPVGVAIGGGARIGKFLGTGDNSYARLSAKACVVGAGAISTVLGAILFLLPHNLLPTLFTSDVALIEMTSRVIPLLAVYVIGDGLQVALNAIIKGCGRQCVLVPIVISAYWLTALPLAYQFTFVRWGGKTNCADRSLCGVVGLVAGMTIGTWLHCILLALYCSCMIDWIVEAELAKDRLNLEKKKYYDDKSTHDDASLASIMSASVKAIDL